MRPLNQKNKYKGFPLSGTPKVFYGKYPYRIKLSGNNIVNQEWEPHSDNSYYNSHFYEILHFCDDYPKTVKLLNGYSRYVYFHSKNTFDMFIGFFKEHIESVAGPLNKEHCSYLATTNLENYWDYKQHVIRSDNFFGKYDTKLIIRYPLGRISRFYGAIHTTSEYKDTLTHFKNVGQTVKDTANNEPRQNQRIIYVNSEDLDDITMFLKLKYKDCIQNIVSVLVVENL